MPRFPIHCALLALLAPVACDDPDAFEAADIEASAAESDEAELEDGSPSLLADDRVTAPQLELVEDDERRADRVLAEVHPDPDTRIYFIQSEEEEDGHFTVDVTIIGRDGGIDYGGLMTAEEATPLELFLAVADSDAPVPEALERAHDWQVEATRPMDAELKIVDIPPAPSAAFEDHLLTGKSTFTCLSWANFQTYMGSRFAGAPGRNEVIDASITTDTIYSPSYQNNWWSNSHVDMVACNYESYADPAWVDSIDANLCYTRGFGGALTTNCGHTILSDGYYIRRIYGPIVYYRKYKVEVDPLSHPSLQSFSGIVKRDA